MAASFRSRRSVLFLPGANPKALTLAETIPADVLVFDLEDAVPPENKEQARRMSADAVADRDYQGKELIIRINGLDTSWAAGDIAAATPASPDGILVPKVSRPEDIRRVRAALRAAGADPETKIWAMVETPLAIINAGAIAATSADQGPQLGGFVLGTNDLAAEAEVRPARDRSPMVPWLSQCVLAARAYGLSVIDGMFNDFNDTEGFAAECAQARMLGMDGKSLIHPNQVVPCNGIFTPSSEELAWAKGIVAAFELPANQGKDVISVNGRTIEKLHLRIAQRMLAIAAESGGPGARERAASEAS